MITIIFEAHGTTYDNEKGIFSGQNDAQLSPLGIKQSKEMGERYAGVRFDTIFTSDLSRAQDSATIAFDAKFPILPDARLRECNVGSWTGRLHKDVDVEKINHVTEPWPDGGESYTETTERMRSFLDDLKENHEGERVMVIGHRATQYGLEHLINGVPLAEAVMAPWKWQPGWEYTL